MREKENSKPDDNPINSDLSVFEFSDKDDTQLFESIYDKYSNLVYRKCLSIVSSSDEAQDLTHDIFIKVFMKLKTFRGDSKFSTWLYSITYYHCINYLSRNSKGKEQHYGEMDDFKIEDNDEEIADKRIYELKVDRLKEAMDKINPSEKMLLIMKYQDGMSIKEIATIFEAGESAIKMRLSRAKVKLINVYGE